MSKETDPGQKKKKSTFHKEQSMSPVERNPRMRRSETEAKRLTPVTASTTPVLEQPIATPVSASELRT